MVFITTSVRMRMAAYDGDEDPLKKPFVVARLVSTSASPYRLSEIKIVPAS